MKGPTARSFAALLLVLSTTAACSGDAEGGASGGGAGASGMGGMGAGGAGACSKAISASPINDYVFSSTLSFPPVLVAPNQELSFDWSAVDSDFIEHPLDPGADIDAVNLMLWKLTETELETKLNDDALAQRDLAVIATFFTENAATSASLFDFTSIGMPLTPEMILPFLDDQAYDPAAHTYTIMLATGEVLGQGTRMIQAFKLDPSSTNTHVVVDSDSTVLDYSVELEALEPTLVPAGEAALVIDWSNIDVNALGNEFVPTSITEALVARYAFTPAELEQRFLDLELIAEETFRATVPFGTSVDLASFTNEAGESFSGIDATGTWIVALICGGCRNPAPWYLSVLEPCSP